MLAGPIEAGHGSPGPGTYDVRSSVGTEGVKPAMVPRRGDALSSSTQFVPGPGAYTISNLKGGVPSYR